ncbi:MAG: ABC transporter ATP-binding protein [Ruminococcus sp.]|nr:ABC transporter ATP-binding protein [Ruminococcus sp.]
MSHILECTGLTKRYPKRDVNAAEDITFSVNEGEIFAIIGPNGAGKTTTIRMIATLLQPTSGEAQIGGFSLVKEPEKIRKIITYLPDEAGAYKGMTGIHYLEFMASLFAENPKQLEGFVQRGEEICKLGDKLRDKIGSYSRGMIRKLLLARAVMTSPKLAIMDEATSGLDVINALEIRRMIKELAVSENMAFLLSSHNMLEIEYLADRVALITDGKISRVGTVTELKAEYNARNLEEVFEKAVSNNAIS